MKITKYIHSCVLVEERGARVLIDPGVYSADMLSGVSLGKLDAIYVTHEHEDHCSIPFLRDVREQDPGVQIFGNASVRKMLGEYGLVGQDIHKDSRVDALEIPHERLLGKAAPENTLLHLFARATHPGDSLQIPSSKEILFLPIQAPWGSMVRAVESAELLAPKVVVPIHDWHWKEEARERLYVSATEYLRKRDIAFIQIVSGQTVEIP